MSHRFPFPEEPFGKSLDSFLETSLDGACLLLKIILMTVFVVVMSPFWIVGKLAKRGTP